MPVLRGTAIAPGQRNSLDNPQNQTIKGHLTPSIRAFFTH